MQARSRKTCRTPGQGRLGASPSAAAHPREAAAARASLRPQGAPKRRSAWPPPATSCRFHPIFLLRFQAISPPFSPFLVLHPTRLGGWKWIGEPLCARRARAAVPRLRQRVRQGGPLSLISDTRPKLVHFPPVSRHFRLPGHRNDLQSRLQDGSPAAQSRDNFGNGPETSRSHTSSAAGSVHVSARNAAG